MRCWLVLGLVTVLIDISIMWLKYSFLATCSFDCCSSSISQIVHFCVVEIGSHFLVGFLSFQLFESDSSQKSIWWPLWATLRDKLRNMREKIMAFSRKWKKIFFNDMKFGRNLYFLVIIISKIRNMILTSCDVITRYLYLLNYDRIFAWKFSLFFLSAIHTWQISTQSLQHQLQTWMFLSLLLTHWLIWNWAAVTGDSSNLSSFKSVTGHGPCCK